MNLNFSIQTRRIFLTQLVFFLFLSIAIIVVDKNSSALKPVRQYLSFAVVPIEQMVTLPSDIYAFFKNLIATKQTLLDQNTRYKTENTLLKASAKQYIALELENIRLREMLNSSYEINSNRLLIARVIGAENSLTKKSISIDKGETSGVYLGQPVLDDAGVMGQVIDIKPMTATVLLISDYQNYTPVMLRKSGKRFLAKGDRNGLVIENVESIQEVSVGDQLVTSGLSGLYPSGYPVATISEIIALADGDETYSIKAEIMAGVDYSQEVILVWSDDGRNLYQIADDLLLGDENSNNFADSIQIGLQTTEGTATVSEQSTNLSVNLSTSISITNPSDNPSLESNLSPINE